MWRVRSFFEKWLCERTIFFYLRINRNRMITHAVRCAGVQKFSKSKNENKKKIFQPGIEPGLHEIKGEGRSHRPKSAYAFSPRLTQSKTNLTLVSKKPKFYSWTAGDPCPPFLFLDCGGRGCLERVFLAWLFLHQWAIFTPMEGIKAA